MHLKVYKGDITKLAVDAIVNAANSSLLGGGGVDGAIQRAAVKTILEETKGFGDEYEVYLVAFDAETELLYQEMILKLCPAEQK